MWRRKKAVAIEDNFSSVQALARQLGVERRMNARVLYPKRTTGPLPAVSFSGKSIKVNDISVGGCCLIDPQETLGKDVGNELTLVLHFAGDVTVRSRLVGRVDHRRHIQFLDLPSEYVEMLRCQIEAAIPGNGMRMNWPPEVAGPQLSAREIWSSLAGEALTLTDDIHKMAQLTVGGHVYTFHKNAYPTDSSGAKVSHERFLELLLFVANIPHPSSAIQLLLAEMEALSLEAM